MDDSQSIYGFRGSDIRNILEFTTDYPEALVVKLEENYRSTKTILEAANQIIKHNKQQKEKTLYTSNSEGEKIKFYEANLPGDEAEFIADEIKKLVSQGYSYRDFAVFYRNNADGVIFETTLAKREIPFVVSKESSFFERMEVKDILSYLKLIVDPKSKFDFIRVANVPKRGIGKTSIEKIVAASNGGDLISISKNPDGVERLNAKTKEGLKEFATVIEKFQTLAKTTSASKLITQLMKDINYKSLFEGLEKYVRLDKENYLEKMVNIADELERKKGKIVLVEEFLNELIKTDVDQEMEEEDNFDRVNLTTIHGAKGLEFPVVFLTGMKEGSFPSQYSLVTPSGVEEERRLCYVAFTRAKELLYLTYPKHYIDKETKEEKESVISRFISEFESNLREEK